MKFNNFATYYESILEQDPNFFDDYLDSDQRIDAFIHESTQFPVERFFEVVTSVLAH
jgi:hypothetical protein